MSLNNTIQLQFLKFLINISLPNSSSSTPYETLDSGLEIFLVITLIIIRFNIANNLYTCMVKHLCLKQQGKHKKCNQSVLVPILVNQSAISRWLSGLGPSYSSRITGIWGLDLGFLCTCSQAEYEWLILKSLHRRSQLLPDH